jgi:hypothetical protein
LHLMDAESLKEWFVAPSDNLAAEAGATSNMNGIDRAISR